jgi:hypothetical protein
MELLPPVLATHLHDIATVAALPLVVRCGSQLELGRVPLAL